MTTDLFSQDYAVLTPAYGRDYKSQSAIKRDFNENKDFVLASTGQYINKAQIKPGTTVSLRYSQMRRVVNVKVSNYPPTTDKPASPPAVPKCPKCGSHRFDPELNLCENNCTPFN